MVGPEGRLPRLLPRGAGPGRLVVAGPPRLGRGTAGEDVSGAVDDGASRPHLPPPPPPPPPPSKGRMACGTGGGGGARVFAAWAEEARLHGARTRGGCSGPLAEKKK
jgi:hypothetical protein